LQHHIPVTTPVGVTFQNGKITLQDIPCWILKRLWSHWSTLIVNSTKVSNKQLKVSQFQNHANILNEAKKTMFELSHHSVEVRSPGSCQSVRTLCATVNCDLKYLGLQTGWLMCSSKMPLDYFWKA